MKKNEEQELSIEDQMEDVLCRIMALEIKVNDLESDKLELEGRVFELES